MDFINVEAGTTLNFGASDIIARAGTNHVNPRGSLPIPLGLFYTSESDDREVSTRVTVQVADESGNVITAGVSWDCE